jgi:hypothetical protein
MAVVEKNLQLKKEDSTLPLAGEFELLTKDLFSHCDPIIIISR